VCSTYAFNSSHQVAMLVTQQHGATPRGVGMKPHSMLLANISNGIEIYQCRLRYCIS